MYVNLFIVCVLFYKPSMHYSESILQMEDVAVQVGDDVTFHCFHPKDQLNRVMWFKQTLGERPVLVASSYHWTQKSILYDDFEKSMRFRVGAGIGSFNLTIQETAQSDSATYYCAVSFSNVVYFGAGTNLVLRGSKSNRSHILQQPHPEITLSGGNVTLLCTIQNEQESCRGDHKVYWFKHGLGKSHSGIIYTQGSCKNSSVSPTKSCVYSLSLRNIKPSDDGTYYCAVVTCKEILFGNGINLVSYDEHKGQHIKIYILIGLAALLTVSFISNILLCIKKMKGNTSQHVHATDNIVSSVQYHRTSDLNYAALKFTRQSSRQQREERQRLTEYSGLKCKNSVL
ncbi:uncharacterized protein LOC109069109 isoform X2 [Cyprinus carpio]|uniref:Uncharacterized protein LOC109069109 isoform X2 n=1 Tax=Cyprinus carpio TaxID=7962 RepID=A0A9R0AZ15_CYPCA|nr:uncharacterized protein LOC109069109 isoform X2 [Cyprinus carpio]